MTGIVRVAIVLLMLAAPLAQAQAQTTPIKWMRWDHVAIRVPNFEESVAWYRDKLGFQVVRQWKGPAFLQGGLDFAYLDSNGVTLEIIGGGQPVRHAAAPANLNDLVTPIGWNHLALRVEDMAATIAALKAHGVEPYAAVHNPVLNRLITQIRDNNGIPIEIVQYLDK